MTHRILDLITAKGSLTAAEFSRETKIPTVLALEFLLVRGKEPDV